MDKLPQISDAEFEIMNHIWKYEPINTNEIVDCLSKKRDWSPKTIFTMLSRLEKKGVIFHEKESRVFVYSSRFPKESYVKEERKNFVNRFFDGAMKQAVVSFLDNNDLSDDDIAELQCILDRKRNQ